MKINTTYKVDESISSFLDYFDSRKVSIHAISKVLEISTNDIIDILAEAQYNVTHSTLRLSEDEIDFLVSKVVKQVKKLHNKKFKRFQYLNVLEKLEFDSFNTVFSKPLITKLEKSLLEFQELPQINFERTDLDRPIQLSDQYAESYKSFLEFNARSATQSREYEEALSEYLKTEIYKHSPSSLIDIYSIECGFSQVKEDVEDSNTKLRGLKLLREYLFNVKIKIKKAKTTCVATAFSLIYVCCQYHIFTGDDESHLEVNPYMLL